MSTPTYRTTKAFNGSWYVKKRIGSSYRWVCRASSEKTARKIAAALNAAEPSSFTKETTP